MTESAPLRRTLSLPMMVLYGLGTTVGAGIYALIGEIAGIAGYLAPVVFLLAALMAGLTALSYAELASRLPRAAGAALYVQRALGSARLGRLTGLAVIAAGTTSAAALTNGFVGYASYFVTWNPTALATATVVVLGVVASWGVAESVAVAAVVTIVEVLGLLAVIATGIDAETLAAVPVALETIRAHPLSVSALLSGALLAFYAFIGFEDMVDLAEEVTDVSRALPRAIVWTLIGATLLYLLLTTVAVLSLAPSTLASSPAPLADLFAHNTGWSGAGIGLVGMFAIINGALIQIIMVSRVLYGLSARGQLPRWLSRVHPKRRTPIWATLAATAGVLALALIGDLAGLAEATSLTMLAIFAVVNFSLWRIKGQAQPPAGFTVPRWCPLAGLLISLVLIGNGLLGIG